MYLGLYALFYAIGVGLVWKLSPARANRTPKWLRRRTIIVEETGHQ
jgi:hypothetical protein